MKLTNRRFTLEDFKEQPWITKLIGPLNSLIQELQNGLKNQITVQDNLFQEFKTLTVKAEPQSFPFDFQTKFTSRPEGLTIIRINEKGSILNGGLTSQPIADWSETPSGIRIHSISGLTSGKVYEIKFHIIYG